MKPKAKLFEIDPHPAIPPADLLKKWEDQWFNEEEHADVLLIRAFQAGADQELEACCEWVSQWAPRWPDGTRTEDELRAARRPKPLSLKEQSLMHLDVMERDAYYLPEILQDLRRAVEQLDD